MGLGAATLDDLVCLRGRFIGIEYKAPGKVPTARQNLTMEQIRQAGGIALWGDDTHNIVRDLKKALDLP